MAPVEVSVVVAAHNAAGTVAGAIASALMQDAAVEVIAVDDASSDGTFEAIRDIRDPRVLPIRLEENAGPGGARNAGIEAAHGDYIAVLDADDAMLPGRLTRLLRRARKTGAAIVLDNMFVKEGEGLPRPAFDAAWMTERKVLDLAAFAGRNHLFAPGFSLGYAKPLVRREVLVHEAIRYDERLRIGEDYHLLAEILAVGHVAALEPRPGYLYRRHAGSTSARLGAEHVAALIEADEALAARYPLDRRTRAALARRRASLERAAAFIAAVDHLKAAMPMRALATIARRPDAAWHFRLPIAARLGRAR